MRQLAGLILVVGISAAEQSERTAMRNVRFCEILVVNRQLLSAKGKVYNTVGLNDCPAEAWAKMDAKKLAKERSATAVVLNGPRYFVMDRNALPSAGATDRFNGLEMRQLAVVEIKNSKRVPYTEYAVDRETRYVYESGNYVYELHSSDGKTYVMQSYSLEVDASLNIDKLLDLGNRLKLPKGWRFQARKVEQDFVVRNAGAQAHVLQDDFKNSYQRLE